MNLHRRFLPLAIGLVVAAFATAATPQRSAAQASYTVSNLSDSSSVAFSLPWALLQAELSGTTANIDIWAGLDGQTLQLSTLTSLAVNSEVTIDASSLPNGFTIKQTNVGFPIFAVYDPFAGAPNIDFFQLINVTMEDSTRAAITSGNQFGPVGNAITLTDCTIRNCSQVLDDVGSMEPSSITSLVMTRCHVSDCTAVADLIVADAPPALTLTLIDSVFTNNGPGVAGGFLFVFANATLTVDNCTFDGNTTGCFERRSHEDRSEFNTVSISDSSFLNGKELYLEGSTTGTNSLVEIERCTFANNTSAGSLIHFEGARIDLVNSTFSNNSSDGKLIRNDGNTISIPTSDDLDARHCTFVDNGSDAVLSIDNSEGSPTVRNSIFSGNTNTGGSVANLDGDIVSTGWNLVNSVDADFSASGDLTSTAAGLGPLIDNGGPTLTHSPLVGSAALDAGNGSGAPSTDQRGFPRIIDSDGNGSSSIDIGAVENAVPIIVDTAIDENNGVGVGVGTSLREAISASSTGGTINFDSNPVLGLNGATIDLSTGLNTHLAVTKSLAIDASNLSNGITIKGNFSAYDLIRLSNNSDLILNKVSFEAGRRAVANIGNGSLSITDATIRDCVNSTAGQTGGALFGAANSSLFLTRCLVHDNTANTTGGGAIYCRDNCDITISASTIQDNIASTSGGGAIYCQDDCDLTVTNTNFQDNTASGSGGGAVFCQDNGDLTITGSCLFRNEANSGNGGAISMGPGSFLTLRRSTLAKNSAANHGGAIYADGTIFAVPDGDFRYVTIGENRCGGDGGACYLVTGGFEFNHCTVYRNSGGGAFGGVPGGIRLSHTIVAENRDASGLHFYNGPGMPQNFGYNLIDVAGGFGPVHPNTNIEGVSPRLSPIGWHGGRCPTYHPLAFSPAIDNGDPSVGGFTQDQRNFFFNRDGDNNGSTIIDIGAVEAFKPVYVTTAVDESNGPTGGAGRSLREAIANIANGGRILFNPGLNGAVSNLTLNAIGFGGKAVVVDATTLPDGFTLDAQNNSRCMRVEAFGGLSMHAVSLCNGTVTGNGGAIHNESFLTLSRAALYDNSCTLDGGAIEHAGRLLILEHCTLSGNDTQLSGGAINISGGGDFCIGHCTIAFNDSNLGIAQSGGIQISSGKGGITHTILANNTGANGTVPKNYAGAATSLVSLGDNLESGTDAGFVKTGDQQSTDPILMALQDDGGYSKVHPTKGPGMDAGDPTFPPGLCCDQRGYIRVVSGGIDIGAYEFDAAPDPDFDGDCMLDSWENANGLDPLAPEDAWLDDDGDGHLNIAEAKAMTDPTDSTSFLRITDVIENLDAAPTMRDVTLTFTSSPGKTYHIFFSTTLLGWEFLGSTTGDPGATTSVLVDDPFPAGWASNPEGFFIITVAP